MKRFLFFFLLCVSPILFAGAQSVTQKGDLTGDGVVNALDVKQLVDEIMTGNADVKTADLTGNGVVNVADVVALVDIINASLSSVVLFEEDAVAVYLMDGKSEMFKFSEEPVVTYSGDNVVIKTLGGTVQYPVYKIRKISFYNSKNP